MMSLAQSFKAILSLSSAAAASEQSQLGHRYHDRQIVSSADSEPSLGLNSGGGFVHRPSQIVTTQTDRSSLDGILDEVVKASPSDRHGIVNISRAGVMDPAKINEGSYVVDVILPLLFMALLFLGNAVIVYVIFQYRKRKAPVEMREEVALSALSNGDPQV